MATAGMALAPGELLAAKKKQQPAPAPKNEKVRIAYIGIGNRGQQNIDEFAKTNMVDVVALCDVDLQGKQCEKALKMYPDAKRFTDFRKLFDEYSDKFDAVAVSVPDHTHFFVCMAAMKHGKHVYCEKPLIRTFQEGEILIEMANRHPELATQVGNQGHSEANYFQFKAWQEAGIIKDVTKVVAHMNNDRRWHKYDWNMTNLGLPYEINMKYAKNHNEFFYPFSSTIEFRFGARGNMPPCDVIWYDGVDNQPPLPEGYGESKLADGIPASGQGEYTKLKLNPGKIIYGRDLTFKGASHGSTLEIIPAEKAKEMEGKLPEVPKSPSNHYVNFLRACKGEEKTRSPFQIAGVLCQVFCLGVIAQRLNTQLFFDPRTKKFTNNEFANAMLSGMPPRRGWEEFYKID